jgi:hypothetical protein
MDFNYLYERERVSLFMAENASSETVRRIHREFGQRYAARNAHAKLPQPGAASA